MKISGIYKIQSKSNTSRCYIGSSLDIAKRKKLHLGALRKGVHHSKKLQNHYNKHGKDDLLFSILIECSRTELVKQEQSFIDLLRPWFNCSPTAGSPLGVKRSEETKALLSRINKGKPGRPLTPEHKELLRKINMNRIVSDETRKKISISRKGIKLSEEARLKISAANKRDGRRPPSAKGRVVSEETRRKLSLAHKGQKPWSKGLKFGPMTLEHRKKLSDSHKGPRPWRIGVKTKPLSEETRKRMSISQKKRGGRSDEFREKIRKSWIIRKQKKAA